MDNQKENKPYFGFFQDHNDEYIHLRANKEGLKYLASKFIEKSESLETDDNKNWQNRTLVELDEELTDTNSDLFLISIEYANEPISKKESKVKFLKLFSKEGFFLLFSFFTLICIIIGFFNIVFWLLNLIY